jgi:hypothetical protein
LGFLRSDCGSLGLIKRAAGDQLNQLLMGQHFLLPQRLDSGLFALEDLLDLRVLVAGEIQFVQRESHPHSAHETFLSAVMRPARPTFPCLRVDDAGH